MWALSANKLSGGSEGSPKMWTCTPFPPIPQGPGPAVPWSLARRPLGPGTRALGYRGGGVQVHIFWGMGGWGNSRYLGV